MVEPVLGRGVVVGARWLLAPSEGREGMVYFLAAPVKIMIKGQKLKLFGKWHLVEEYNFACGRM